MIECYCDGGGGLRHEASLYCTVNHPHLVQLWECNTCKARYPIVPYYRVAAPHGPNKDCLGEQGWTMIADDLRAQSVTRAT